MKDVQAKGEASCPQKKTSSTSKQEISQLFFVGHFAFLDPDPAGQTQSGSMRIRIHNTVRHMVYQIFIAKHHQSTFLDKK
jgi:hypothetical protein